MTVPVRTSLPSLLARAERRVAGRLESALASAELTPEQWRVLSLLADGQGHAMSEVAGYAMVPPPTLTKIVDRLISRTLMFRRVDSMDRRRVLVFLSGRGTELFAEVNELVRAAEQDLTDELGAADAALLAELLGRLLDRLD